VHVGHRHVERCGKKVISACQVSFARRTLRGAPAADGIDADGIETLRWRQHGEGRLHVKGPNGMRLGRRDLSVSVDIVELADHRDIHTAAPSTTFGRDCGSEATPLWSTALEFPPSETRATRRNAQASSSRGHAVPCGRRGHGRARRGAVPHRSSPTGRRAGRHAQRIQGAPAAGIAAKWHDLALGVRDAAISGRSHLWQATIVANSPVMWRHSGYVLAADSLAGVSPESLPSSRHA
jgi:hypothetical protein